MIKSSRAAVLTSVALALAGCSVGGVDTGAAPASATLRVGLVEWRIITSAPAVTAGVDRLTVTNTGTTAHDLHVLGPGIHVHTPLLSPGARATLTLTSRAGTTLTLACEVPGHEAAGMRATLAVTDAATASTVTGGPSTGEGP